MGGGMGGPLGVLTSGDGYELAELGAAKGLAMGPGPSWTVAAEQIQETMADLDRRCKQLVKLHDETMREVFNQKEKEQAAEMLTKEITALFRRAKGQIKVFGELPCSAQEQVVKTNMQKDLASRLQAATMSFRQRQKVYLAKLQKRSQTGSRYSVTADDDAIGAEDDMVDPGFTDSQMSLVRERQRLAETRSREIEEIHQSIVELAEVFQEMAALVAEQGTILDRIDYNIETTSHNVAKAVSELGKSHSYQKSARNKLIILAILLLIFGAIAVVLVRVGLKFFIG